MNFMDKLERKWGKYTVPGLHKYLVGAYFIGFLLEYLPGDITSYLMFDMNAILGGQIWRLVTWVLCGTNSSMFTLLFLFCLIPMGQHLERFIGSFRMNVYLIGGILINIVGAILIYLISLPFLGMGLPVYLSSYYILLSIFMALAMCMPDATVNLYFILPIKMKWMLIVYFLELAYEVYIYYSYGASVHWVLGLMYVAIYGSQIIFAVANLFLFFRLSKVRPTRAQKKRQKEFQAQFKAEARPGANITRHKCVICGRTEVTNPELTFRYCSKCTGNKEYCQDHLFTHTHN